jgi:hypothetical protein
MSTAVSAIVEEIAVRSRSPVIDPSTAKLPVMVPPDNSSLSVFRFVKLLSTSAWVSGDPFPERVTIVAMD